VDVFGKKKAGPRVCPEGHELEESWEQCPFCAAEKKEEAPRRTVVVSKPAGPQRRLAGWVVAIGGEQDGDDFRLRVGRNLLGKGDKCDVVLKDAQVSERHAVVEFRPEERSWNVEDLESRHGTWLNGKRLGPDGRPLADGDRLRLGKTELLFRALEPPGTPRR
jgi:hypothetical protein